MSQNEIWLISVTAGRWQKHGIKEARAAGLKVLAIDADPNAEGFAFADEFLIIDLNDHVAVIQAVKALNKNIRGAISFASEIGVILAGHLREAFNLPGPNISLCKKLVNKSTQRKIWSENSVPVPKWVTFQEAGEALEALSKFGVPLIIKPTDSSGSRGVTKIESMNDDLDGAVKRAFMFSRFGEVILEEFMDGTEFTVEIFAINYKIHILAVTEKKNVDGTRGTVADELATPARSNEVIKSISSVVEAAFLALGYYEGPGHAEVILKGDNSLGLVEAAGRGGGFMVFDKLVPLISGVNIARLTALQAVGLPFEEFKNIQKSAVLRFFPSKPGVLRSITGFDEANSIAGVEAAPFSKVGDRFQRASVDGDRLGYILSCAESPRRAQYLADKAENFIHFEFENVHY